LPVKRNKSSAVRNQSTDIAKMSKSSAESGEPAPEMRPDHSGDRPGGPIDGRGGDHEAWREVLEEVRGGLRNFLAGKLPQAADVDDCLQSVSVAMLNNQTEIPPAARRAWLYRVAANEAARWWRDKSTTDRILEKHAGNTPGVDTTAPSRMETQELVQQVNQAIENLSDNSRRIVRMRLNDGMTFQAIADQLQLPLGTVLTRMRRAMQQLRNQLDK
jgi:RNA polymerase sigma-70 factor (ECF subfamily)